MVALLLPISRGRLEANLIGHVLVQMPLLASSGWFLGSALEPKLDKVMERWNRFGRSMARSRSPGTRPLDS
jgi:hypothetical protein